jgi:hypothetical protein
MVRGTLQQFISYMVVFSVCLGLLGHLSFAAAVRLCQCNRRPDVGAVYILFKEP